MSDDQILRDHGLEIIRKSGEEIPPRDPTDKVKTGYRLRTRVTNTSSEAIPVEIVDGVLDSTVNTFNSISSIVSSTPTDLVTYTVPTGKTFKVKHIEVSGTNVAEYLVKVDASNEAKRRTYWSGFDSTFDFSGLILNAGQVIKVVVEHDRTETGDFDGRILGDLSD